ncbi:MAG: ABC transporter ATP-binding protein [Candidatus Binatia bacterium]
MDDVSFTVARGEVAALLGPNGSGKTTLMRMLTGFFSPTAGRVTVGGIDVGEAPLAARRRIGYLPEQVSLYPDLTVRRFLAFVAEVRGLVGAARRRAVTEVIDRCMLDEVADRVIGKLSKGFRQRVGLAQALVGDPEVLVLDEPTVGLDPVQTVELRDLIRSLTGRTVLLSTHALAEASALCTRVVILSRGRLVAEDTALGLARRLAGVATVHVRVEGDGAAGARVLAALPGVMGVEPGVPDGGGGTAFTVHAREALPVQRAVAGAVAAVGCTLLELHVTPPTLEDVFVRLVREARGAGH